ncbi:AcrB/AcrD/AcrF family protein [Maribellus comscasis]|uniref:AcrB/AcrD/AcrF family protein n=2 Tax=Maribellus comscasis TaxID=2681766 RepID=A0A6I6JZR8_9BACT|nr:AcrB/AcrD/AcrF family protein [Maribellus comscasis]
MTITELSIKRPLLITVAFVVMILFGVLGYLGLNYELLPKFDAGVITVRTVYMGASPQEIESSVTKPIEDAISATEGVDIVTSRSMQNMSAISVQLKNGVDDVNTQQDIERKINQIKSTLPEDADDPVVNRVSTDQFPVVNLSVSAAMTDADLYQMVDEDIVPILSNVSGVGQISVIGGVQRKVKVLLNNYKLDAYKIPVSQVYQALNAAAISLPGGKITSHEQEFSVWMDADLSTADMIRDIVIRENANGSRVQLKDIAEVSDATSTPVTINRINGQNGIGLQIYKTNNANAVEVSEGVKEKLEDLKGEYSSKEFAYEIASDQSDFTLSAADAVVHDLFLAVIIVSFVMLLFLHSLRSSLFVLVAIPSALIPTFIMMNVFGFSLNLMTLTALSLVVGILVDDSIVILENIFRHLEMGKDKVQAAIEGRSEIGFTAVAITMVDLVVFIPLAFTTGLIGNIIRQFSLTVVFSTLMSLLVSFTLTPLLAAKFGKLIHLSEDNLWGRINLGFERIIDSIKTVYGDMLHWVLHHKRYLLILVIVLIVGSLALVPTGFIGSTFIETGDNGQLSLKIELSSDMSLYQTNHAMKKAEEVILSHPEVRTAYSLVGTQTTAAGSTNNSNWGQIDLTMIDKTERDINVDNFGRLIRDELEEEIPGIKVTALPIGATGSANFPIQIVVKGPSLDEVKSSAGKIKDIVVSTPGTDYVDYSTQGERKQVQIEPDRDKLSSMGFTTQDIAQYLNLSFNGNDNIKMKEEGDEYEINFIMNDSYKQNVDDVENLAITNKMGKVVRLSQLADIDVVSASAVLERTNRLPSMTITSAAVGRPSGSIVADIQEKIEQTELPSSISIEYLGDQKRQTEAFSSLGAALIIGILLIYFIMVALYESLVYPFVVLFSIPVATIGAFLALGLTMNNLSIFTISGIIMLLGLVAKNGILIVDFANHIKEQGLTLTEVVVEAGKERLRPIIMTTVAMILGMLPLAISNSLGSEFKSGMAWVLIGGLSSSLLFTLFLVPSVYMIVEKMKIRFSSKKKTNEV